jgi:hypothetical protein
VQLRKNTTNTASTLGTGSQCTSPMFLDFPIVSSTIPITIHNAIRQVYGFGGTRRRRLALCIREWSTSCSSSLAAI